MGIDEKAGTGKKKRHASRERTVKKYSVSLPETLAEEIRERVGPGEFSAYVAAAVQRQAELDALDELVANYEAKHGPVPEEYVAEADRMFEKAEKEQAEWRAAE